MGNRERLNCYGIVLIDYLAASVDNIKLEFIGTLTTEEIEHALKKLSALLEDMDCHHSPLVVKSHCREQAKQAKTVIAMQVADEDVIKTRHLQVHALHFKLRALAAVNHHKVSPDV